MAIFDSHAHYDDEKFDGIREELLQKAFDTDVQYICNVASDINTSLKCIELSKKYSQIFAAVGIHPHECENLTNLNESILKVKELLNNEKVVAIGEIGLDYHYDLEFKSKQIEYFDSQLSLSEETGYPVIIHDREAHGDTMDLLRVHKNANGILHSFSGSSEMARQLSSRGFYISFSGTVTFKNASKILDAVRMVPDDLLLVETDCPYLAPVPHRGEINFSGNIPFTLKAIADARNQDIDYVEHITFENAKKCFKIK